jgi:superfamily II DNA or RNA helicase
MKLRPYQNDAANACFEAWRENTSTLIVVPTGGGKTQIFADIIRRFQPQRAIVIAHREELIFQARERIEMIAGVGCQVEMADMTASNDLFTRAPCVIATVQTLHRRLERFDPMGFGLLVIDEVHHATAGTYRKIIDHFKRNTDLRILGVTATPDRADEEALGQIFDTVAYDYEILDAIHDGWLVPVDQQVVHVGDLDFSQIRTTAGDLNSGDLAAVMEAEKNLQGVVGSSLEIIGERQTILFAVSVIQAEKACEIFNRHRDGMATFISGTTDKEERRDKIAKFKNSQTQVLCNVGIATEGSDFPNVSVIVMARPTKSRSLYAQMAGRALRPLAGLVDQFETPDERKAAIARSSKPSALLVDFAGNSGKHKLMTSADILGGKVSDEAIERAVVKVAKAGTAVRMVEVLEEEEELLRVEKEQRRIADEARRARLVARVQYQTRKVNPFDVLDISPAKERGWDSGRKLSEKQAALLLKQGIDGRAMPYAQAKQLLNNIFMRWDKRLATFKQCGLLKKHYPQLDIKTLSMKDASSMIDALAKNGWRKPTDAPPIQKPVQESVPF